MSSQQYDITYDDLNPTFLFTCCTKRTESEDNYHCHDHLELCIISSGQGIFHIDGQDLPVKAGDLIILNPGTYHQSLVSHPQNCTVEYYIGFCDIHIRDLERDRLPLLGGSVILPMADGIKQDVFKICSSMAKEFQTCQPGRYFMLKAYLIQIILLLLREQKNTAEACGGCIFESTNKKYVVRRMITYFEEHYREKISLDQVARNMYLSPFYISKIFKSETGDTPINYLIRLRMERARDLMESRRSLTIQDVASQVGYEDVRHFSKLFKKLYGTAPSRYRSSI